MNKLLLLLCIVSTTMYAQSFEGTLTYKIEYDIQTDKAFGVSKGQILETLKESGDYFDTLTIRIKDGNYEKTANSKERKRIVYTSSDHKIYTIDNGFEYVLIQNAKKYAATKIQFGKPTFTQNDSLTTIAGKECISITLDWNGLGQETYFYNDTFLNIDPELFKDHKFEYFYDILKRTKSYPTQINKSLNGLMEIRMILVDYVSEEIPDSSFDIPELEPAEKEYTDIIKETTGNDVMRIKN
ncbi:hypothetical protein [uncultured Dokdonia sp.]|uniref:hypothetical protein n=1 Tax=uncultured Dokdonia sp. TaxID=575653 RepID=UPI00262E1C4C|nr:hypothetical protein [uncultured Dokdonia sp.]